MEPQRYDGNIHPDEWIDNLSTYYRDDPVDNAKSLVDFTIKNNIVGFDDIHNLEDLCNSLKRDISFTVFKNTNKKKLQSLKYDPEKNGGDNSKFFLTFRKLCYNAEIILIEKQKEYLYKSLSINKFNYISNKFYEQMEGVTTMNVLIKNFEDLVLEESDLITNESVVALKHVASSRYLCSKEGLCYETGSMMPLVYVGKNSWSKPNSLWKIKFDKVLDAHGDNYITLQHIKSNLFLKVYPPPHSHYNSPISRNIEVCCTVNDATNWKYDILGSSHRRYLKSNDIINLRTEELYDNGRKNSSSVFLCSNIENKFTITHYCDGPLQEVVCHNGVLGRNDEWRIELFKQA